MALIIRVLLFGPVAMATGTDSIAVTLAASPNCADLLRAMGEQWPGLRRFAEFARVAVNHRYADASELIAPDDEVALICMVSGG